MNSQKTSYYIVLGLFSAAVIGSIINSIINYDEIALVFVKLGYPTYLIYILGLFQSIGILLILLNRPHWSLEWTYAGFFMNYFLGAIAHLAIKDGNGASAVVCIILLFVTYVQSKKMSDMKTEVRFLERPEYS
ncbi:DoxX family protein [Maribacter sp. X9]|uniref:DoxX family protein n=1 Tax=Maribacter sp. X9 TaxID=3402159 RepID=UPI003AF3DEE1